MGGGDSRWREQLLQGLEAGTNWRVGRGKKSACGWRRLSWGGEERGEVGGGHIAVGFAGKDHGGSRAGVWCDVLCSFRTGLLERSIFLESKSGSGGHARPKATRGPGEWGVVAWTSWGRCSQSEEDCFPGEHKWSIVCYNAWRLRSHGNFPLIYLRRAKVMVFLPVQGFLFIPFQEKQ